jgi:hypothetical protein
VDFARPQVLGVAAAFACSEAVQELNTENNGAPQRNTERMKRCPQVLDTKPLKYFSVFNS